MTADSAEWIREFRQSRAGRGALEQLRQLRHADDDGLFADVEWICCVECFRAASGEYDQRAEQRATKRRFEDDKVEAQRAARVLAKFLEEHGAGRWAMMLAIADTMSGESGERKDSVGEYAGLIHHALEHFAERLEGAYEREFRSAPGLFYPTDYVRQHKPRAFTEDALMFRLAYHVLNYADGRGPRVMRRGLTLPHVAMPRGGWSAISALINATLGTSLTADTVRKRTAALRDQGATT